MLGPVIALALWTHVMWGWMFATRLPAIGRARMKLDPTARRGEQMNALPAEVRWKADNYNHLMEQPTVFYAVALTLALTGVDGGWSLAAAWAYVALRVAHSVWQSAVNEIKTRFALFVLSSLVLVGLTVRAALSLF